MSNTNVVARLRKVLVAMNIPHGAKGRIYNTTPAKMPGVRRLQLADRVATGVPTTNPGLYKALKAEFGTDFITYGLKPKVVVDYNFRTGKTTQIKQYYLFVDIINNEQTKPKASAYVRPPVVSRDDKIAFWNSVVNKPVTPDNKQNRESWGMRTLTQDIAVFKKVLAGDEASPVIANLIIPAGTKVHISDGKCRAAKAEVVSMFRQRGKRKEVKKAYSGWTWSFIYRKGATVTPKHGFGTRLQQCEGGIHFFVDINEALDY